ncbi:hypothetical protein B0H10DRAFT_2206649 [Mycena sp. CBHHK59/15]|nr:hypothetical protein B0H10DRAFT_2206649 [Mycena sp. CBHHK59/15]
MCAAVDALPRKGETEIRRAGADERSIRGRSCCAELAAGQQWCSGPSPLTSSARLGVVLQHPCARNTYSRAPICAAAIGAVDRAAAALLLAYPPPSFPTAPSSPAASFAGGEPCAKECEPSSRVPRPAAHTYLALASILHTVVLCGGCGTDLCTLEVRWGMCFGTHALAPCAANAFSGSRETRPGTHAVDSTRARDKAHCALFPARYRTRVRRSGSEGGRRRAAQSMSPEDDVHAPRTARSLLPDSYGAVGRLHA